MARVKKSVFKMKGYTYPGTSPVTAKEKSVVSQARTEADPSLTWASKQLGKSYVPGAIDYTIDNTEIKVPEKSEKKEKSSEEWLEGNQKKIDNATGKKRNRLIDKRNKYKKKKGIK